MRVEHLKEKNLRKAIEGYKRALEFFKRSDATIKYSEIQVLVGIAYGRLAEVRAKEDNLQLAIKAFEEALTVYTRDAYPEPHKIVTHNLKQAKAKMKED